MLSLSFFFLLFLILYLFRQLSRNDINLVHVIEQFSEICPFEPSK